MDTYWTDIFIGFIAGMTGSALMLALLRKRRRPHEESETTSLPRSSGTQQDTATVAIPLDSWTRQLNRCEQAVCRGYRAVESVSSTPARHGLQSVVRRMEAELPDVRAMVELGRGLGPQQAVAARRVAGQLDDAATRFALVTEAVLEAVAELVTTSELPRLHQRVRDLRGEFPLLRPLSAMLSSDAPEGGQALIA